MMIEWGAYYVVKNPQLGIPPIIKVYKPIIIGDSYTANMYVAVDQNSAYSHIGWRVDNTGRILLSISGWISHKASSLEIELA
jgi:hypothetical protein